MKIIIGLGNPGVEFMGTRHNAGQMVVDKLAQVMANLSSYGWRRRNNIEVWDSPGMVLVKSAGIYMNESGRIVQELLDKYHLTPGELYAAHDDLDIRLGEYKINYGKGPKDHGGVNSLIGTLRTEDFWRIRVGVDSRDPANRESGEEYVLKKMSQAEWGALEEVIQRIANEITQTNN